MSDTYTPHRWVGTKGSVRWQPRYGTSYLHRLPMVVGNDWADFDGHLAGPVLYRFYWYARFRGWVRMKRDGREVFNHASDDMNVMEDADG